MVFAEILFFNIKQHQFQVSMDVFIESIKDKIDGFNHKQNILFCLMTCEKLLPNYMYFSERNHWGYTSILEESLVTMYDFVSKSTFNEKELEKILIEIESITPDLDDFSDFTAS